ncbi:hypothetical protein D3C76_1230070 [compost metagenome]
MSINSALPFTILNQVDEFFNLIIHRFKHLRQRKLLNCTITIVNFHLIRLIDFVDHHRTVLSMNLSWQIGVGNLGVHNYRIHIVILHNETSFTIHT